MSYEDPEKRMIRDPASFRDPASQVYFQDGKVYRLIDKSYQAEYRKLTDSGLYQDLINLGCLVPHIEILETLGTDSLVISPRRIPFISYPYEWSFSQLKAMALETLTINELAMDHGMTLKDASAYNLQWLSGAPCFIDTCSFTTYKPGKPWGAYTQFLRHFVAPLLLMKYSDPNDVRMLQYNIDGIPIQYASKRVPFHALFSIGMWAHVKSQSLNFVVNPKKPPKWKPSMSQLALNTLLHGLYKFIDKLTYKPKKNRGFMDYEHMGSYSLEAKQCKDSIVRSLLEGSRGFTVLDLGCNKGEYSVMAADMDKDVIAIDSEHDCINEVYIKAAAHNLNILPLIVDICNPSPGIGWAHCERKPFWERIGVVDCILALAFLHHVCIRNGVPLHIVADLLKDHCKSLIIEWIPPDDPKAVLLYGARETLPEYSHNQFLDAFSRYFDQISGFPIKGSGRIIYYMEGVKNGA